MEQFDIHQLIGEATEYDKKQALEVKKPKSWCKSVSAFAYGIGGKLVWGGADDNTLVGLADATGDAEKISDAIKSHIDPIPDFKLSFVKFEEKEFVVLDVMSEAQTSFYYIGDGQMQAFVRVGNESVVASVAKHKELVLKGSHLSYDSQVSFVLTLPKFNVDGVSVSNGDDTEDISEQGGQKGDFTETLQKPYRYGQKNY